ncbi:MAG: 3-keto-disaccharide hydrolase, partial [Bryobacteraceae bacterium]
MSVARINRRAFSASLLAPLVSAQPPDWVELFNGQTLDGWKPNESPSSWRVEGGSILAAGPRSHLFYEGPVQSAQFRNFELEVEAMAEPMANSGVYFHTAFQPEGWPARGFEVQINNTATGEGNYRENKKTGSL